ncbi:hypothetical protein G6F57_000710 [Rhizopus arrhizus]|uniref:RRM domain-containing protein n=1 Tax=Rhizopus oryzae TaxID=64495 RepID=A0A9P6XIU0_RHIOR|nr:hypothetical protein G6F33_003156 [Rhizopus arrhizus]KAG1421887.1 hypothetical protein G6F58_003559 [Rhizopus delemar]KAG0951863.1 hypothetical protein G6F30_000858 [Rhizopus arrhizus]KAG0957631.1 hypothetical protein G6F32_000998 [Rhizopus arrhizus]KAG0988624.1 hypothetical protein G6F29_001617 [Rhizopus arrhizus]
MAKEKKEKKSKKSDVLEKKAKKVVSENVEKKDKKEKKEKKSKENDTVVKEEKKSKKSSEDNDTFNVLTEMAPVAEDNAEDEKVEKKKKKKELTEEEKEEQRKINRESREKKKLKKELNKKRKRGELVEEEKEEESKEGEEEDDKEAKKPKVEKKKKEPEFGVWVGNLSYSTTVETIRNFFTDCGSITRVKCPKGNGVKNKNKGFAYIFFATAEEQAKAVAKSEQELEGRSLLIKDAENFERADGSKAPTEAEKKEIKKQKNPPCPTIFLGNLSFDTTEKSIREAFEWAGDIRKVRVATFEDSGKCKGFAYVDYHTVEAATKAIRAPDKHTFDGRKCRVEFASEEAHMRSKPWLMREKKHRK